MFDVLFLGPKDMFHIHPNIPSSLWLRLGIVPRAPYHQSYLPLAPDRLLPLRKRILIPPIPCRDSQVLSIRRPRQSGDGVPKLQVLLHPLLALVVPYRASRVRPSGDERVVERVVGERVDRVDDVRAGDGGSVAPVGILLGLVVRREVVDGDAAFDGARGPA